METKFNINAGETTPDHLFTLETVNCLGACALGPIVVVNDEYSGQMTVQKSDALMKRLLRKEGLD
jgi:NADH-quinone oxidoreductase subunit E